MLLNLCNVYITYNLKTKRYILCQNRNTGIIQSRFDYFLIFHILKKSIKRTEIQAHFLETSDTFVLYIDTFVIPPLRESFLNLINSISCKMVLLNT